MRSRVHFVLIFVAACIVATWLHEFGHAVFAWAQGIAVLPTLAKEYVLRPEVEWRQEIWIALGGVLATVIIAAGTIFWYWRQSNSTTSAALAGVLVAPGAYTLRFVLIGRGHDGLEWQEAQGALGLNPSGHVVDWLMLALFLAGCAALVYRMRTLLRWRSLLPAAGLVLLGLVTLVVLQVGNNAVFDRYFPKTQTLHVPIGIDTR